MHRGIGKVAKLSVLLLSLLVAPFPHSELAAQSAGDSGPAPLPDSSTNDGDADVSQPTFGGGTTDDGDITTGVDTGPSGAGGVSPGPASFGPQCTWVPATISNLGGTSLPSDVVDNTDINVQISNDQGDFGWLRLCPGDLVAEFVWQGPVDPVDLVPGASARARARLPLPVPDMSPTPEVGSVVNLGLWFAIEDPGVTTARATLGNAWAQVQGSFDSVSIDPGDGSPTITCDGLGTPYPEGSDDPNEGPCGHTYLQRTPDDQPHQMTYTITYALTWTTSDGGSGSLGTFDRAVTFDYDIDEIQTVGTG